MENVYYSQSTSSYPPIISDISNQLSKAGRYLLQLGVLSVERVGTVYELVIDQPLDENIFNDLYRLAAEKHGYILLQIRSTPPVLRLVPVRKAGKWSGLMKILLFSLTFTTVYLTGYAMATGFSQIIGSLVAFEEVALSFAYTLAFLTALGVHEYGHMIASRRSRVVVEGPFFIPAPPLQLGFLGTLGAVITMRSIPPDRRSLAQLGLAGPLAGFIAGFAIGVAGLFLSPTIQIEYARQLIAEGKASEMIFTPLALTLMFALKPIPQDRVLFIHPILFASYVVLLVTFVNLMPVGQLDGGHVARAYLSTDKHELLGWITPLILVVAGIAVSGITSSIKGSLYIAIGIITLILKLITGKKPHPGFANQYSELKDYRYLIVYFALLALTAPIPA